MAEDGYGWNEYSPFKTSSGEDISIYLSITFIEIMNLIHSFISEKLGGKIDIRLQNKLLTTDFIRSEGLKNYFLNLNEHKRQLAWVERYYEFHTGMPIDLVQDFPLELLSLTYRRCFANCSFATCISMIAEHSRRYNIFKRDEIQELSRNRVLKDLSARLHGEAGGDIDSRSFGFLPMYLLLKFLSSPANEPMTVFREEKFSFVGLVGNSNPKLFRIGYDEYEDTNDIEYLGLIQNESGGDWRITSNVFRRLQPFTYITTIRKKLVRNLIHESIQSKVDVGGVKRIPMNYFRRGVFFES